MLASSEDVAARLGRSLTIDEDDLVEGLLDEASVLVEGWLGCTPDPVPDGVRIVVSRVAARAIAAGGSGAEPGLQSVEATMGVFQVNRGFSADVTSGGVWLTRNDKTTLRPFSCRGRVGNVPTA
jgi:hypothetical protein